MDPAPCSDCLHSPASVLCHAVSPYFSSACHLHIPRLPCNVLATSTDPVFPIAVSLTHNPLKAEKVFFLGTKLPIAVTNEGNPGKTRETNAALMVLCPAKAMKNRFNSWLLHSLISADFRYPNEFIGDVQSEKLLIAMVKRRIPVNTMQLAFWRWPKSKRPLDLLRAIVKSHYGEVEIRDLMQVLMPVYVPKMLIADREQTHFIVNQSSSSFRKTYLCLYIHYTELLFLLLAFEKCLPLHRLPGSLLRLIIETHLMV